MTRSRGSPPRRGGSRAQPSLTVQDPAGGWNALFQSKPPPAGTHPLSRPRQKRPPGVCLGACRGIDSPQSPGKGEPEAPLPRGACNSHPSPSVLLRVGPRRHRNTADPRSLQRGSFPLTICPSLSLLYVFRGGKKCFLVFLVPGVGNDRGKIAQRKQAAERGSSRGSPPSGHRVVGRHWHRTKALTSCEPRYGAGAT